MATLRTGFGWAVLVVLLCGQGCAGSDSGGTSSDPGEIASVPGSPADQDVQPSGNGGEGPSSEPADTPAVTGGSPPVNEPAAGTGGPSAPAPGSSGGPQDPATMAGTAAPPVGGGAADPPGDDPAVTPPTPATGDPNGSGEVVSIPETNCGPAAGLDVFVAGTGIPGPGTPNVQIGGRDVVVSYPCDKREGAHVTFILNLHGTMPDETLKLYQHGYFSAHNLVTSHNLIVVSPKSVSSVGQWDNMAPEDIPHLYEVVDWVYSKFSQFQITSMWIGGHSWGAMFSKRFVCDPMFEDKVRGVIGMSGGPIGPACASRLSQIHTAGELEGGAALNPDQTAYAAEHGCDAMAPIQDIGNGQMLYDWPNCDPGWVHFNFSMGAHDHITAIDAPVVEYIVDAIKSTEL